LVQGTMSGAYSAFAANFIQDMHYAEFEEDEVSVVHEQDIAS